MFLSVIIPTRNRAKLLEKALDSFLFQSYHTNSWEIIVVDNGSTDDTEKVCDRFKSRMANMHYIYDVRPGLHVGRHAGVKKASGDILVFGDDDIEAMPTWLESIAESFKDQRSVLVGGKVLPKFEFTPPSWLNQLWEKPHAEGKVLSSLSLLDLGDHIREISPFFVYGCNFSIRKDILLQAGGFHPDGMPNDLIRFRGDGESHISDFIFRKEYTACYHPMASVYHFVSASRMTEKYFCDRAFKQGISDSYRDIRFKHMYPNSHRLTRRNGYIQRIKSIIRLFNRKMYRPSSFEIMIRESYKKGYDYHCQEVENDHQLLDWVIKENYFV